ncbi:acetamidase/formamidase family protein [Amycolatopsis samaneae]|uniref:Acetamidase/formamidase family protein n=1 Tax=Amycolatopsis samaneae TaxID=664691 RepID=A0ABW5GGZ9_9PSEU
MSVHTLEPSPDTVHGCFDNTLPPVLTVDSGDTIRCATMDGSWGEAGARLFGLPPGAAKRGADDGHPLLGPVFVRDARPGDVLEVTVVSVRPGSWGWTAAGPREGRLRRGVSGDEEILVGWHLDVARGQAHDANGLGVTVPLAPFLGVIGTAPAAPGRHATRYPRRVGGNLDCRELVAGSTLLLPVEVAGALLSVGDGHAAQGDGELSSTALECPMAEVELTVRVREGLELAGPQARTPAGRVVLGLGADLDEATEMAVEGALAYLRAELGLDRSAAVAVASLVVNLRITQIANGTVGVHALITHEALTTLRG